MGEISFKATSPVRITNQCVVFAETEVISMVNSGSKIPDVISGLHTAMANRISSMVKGIGGVEREVTMAGGVAKNKGIYTALEEALGVKMVPMALDPQLNGAVGAALFAREAMITRGDVPGAGVFQGDFCKGS
jgi:activator of 2-hydroxyglutaryl-CoA dehydratase